MSMYQDINLSDKPTREELLEYWADDNVSNMKDIFDDNPTKAMVAAIFNAITSDINDVEQNREAYKASIIRRADTPPSGMTTGQVYFQNE